MKGRFLISLSLALVCAGVLLLALKRTGEHVAHEPSVSTSTPTSEAKAAPAAQPAAPVVAAADQKPVSSLKEVAASESDHAQLRTLNEILTSRNDNDPRLDKEFNALTPAAKDLLRNRYAEYAAEKRNEKGTIVFLLGRNISTTEDIAFMGQVLGEEPCRSMENCAREAGNPGSSDAHHQDAGTEVSLAYPQIIALKSLESYLFSDRRDPKLLEAALRQLQAARDSQVRKVSELANEIHRRYETERKSHGSS